MPKRSAKRSTTRVADTATLPLFEAARQRHPERAAPDDVAERPDYLSTGLTSLDKTLKGGFPRGAATLVAARPKVGATSLLMGAALAALKRGERVAYFSNRLKEEKLRGRLVVLESRVNGYRFRAGFVTAEDRVALAAARERIPWSALTLVTGASFSADDVEPHLFGYHPWLVIADLLPRGSSGATTRRTSELLECVERLAVLAAEHQVFMVVRAVLPVADHPPNRLELPGVGAMAEAFSSVILLHREEVTDPEGVPDQAVGSVDASVIRLNDHDIEPRPVPLRFDQRFAGIMET